MTWDQLSNKEFLNELKKQKIKLSRRYTTTDRSDRPRDRSDGL